MGFLTFLGIASAVAYGMKTETKSSIDKFRKEDFLKSVNYEINIKRDFGTICYICGVRQAEPGKYLGMRINDRPSVWPQDGWKQCIPFLEEQPTITDEDILEFIDCYHTVRQESLKALQDECSKVYKNVQNVFHTREIPTDFTIYEQNHWGHISIEEHQKRTDDIYYNTFWNKISAGPAKIIGENPSKRREIWKVKAYDNILLNNYYHACKDQVGYNKYLL